MLSSNSISVECILKVIFKVRKVKYIFVMTNSSVKDL